MKQSLPRVSIGMPVYNGARYLKEAIDSLLAQTYADFELIISDNASTDSTAEIIKEYAAKDRRLRCYRNEKNLGLAANQNRVYELARGEYFMLAHHDDVRAPECLERCLEILDRDPAVVVCYTKTQDIDDGGNFVNRTDPPLNVGAHGPLERFRDLIRMDHICEADFGLMRMSYLRRTKLYGDYADSDRVLLAELGLYGRFHQIPETLFYRRAHSLQSTEKYPDRQSRTGLFNPAKIGKLIFPHFREFVEYFFAINRVPLPWRERLGCYWEMAKWLKANRQRLAYDLRYAFKEVVRPVYRALVPAH
jgi:glycosyltransferase involved in cell wall biosynthesis